MQSVVKLEMGSGPTRPYLSILLTCNNQEDDLSLTWPNEIFWPEGQKLKNLVFFKGNFPNHEVAGPTWPIKKCPAPCQLFLTRIHQYVQHWTYKSPWISVGWRHLWPILLRHHQTTQFWVALQGLVTKNDQWQTITGHLKRAWRTRDLLSQP